MLKENLAICEHNLRLGVDNHEFANLASEISRLPAEISQLKLKAKPILEQKRAMLLYSAAVHSFRKSCVDARPYNKYAFPHTQPFWLPENIWHERYPGVSPPARPSDYG